jgi:hypothetical protein
MKQAIEKVIKAIIIVIILSCGVNSQVQAEKGEAPEIKNKYFHI